MNNIQIYYRIDDSHQLLRLIYRTFPQAEVFDFEENYKTDNEMVLGEDGLYSSRNGKIFDQDENRFIYLDSISLGVLNIDDIYPILRKICEVAGHSLESEAMFLNHNFKDNFNESVDDEEWNDFIKLCVQRHILTEVTVNNTH